MPNDIGIEDFNLDFSDVKADEYTLPPKGQHMGKVEEVRMRVGKDSGIPYMRFRVSLTEGEGEGRMVYTNVSLGSTDPEKHIKMQGRVKAFLISFGFTDPNIGFKVDRGSAGDVKGQILLEPEFTDLPCEVVIRHNTDADGVKTYDVTRFTGKVTTVAAPANGATTAPAQTRRTFK